MSVAETFEPVPENKQGALLRELETRTENLTVEYNDGDAAHEGLILRITGSPSRLLQAFRTKHPYIRDYRIVSTSEPAVGR